MELHHKLGPLCTSNSALCVVAHALITTVCAFITSVIKRNYRKKSFSAIRYKEEKNNPDIYRREELEWKKR